MDIKKAYTSLSPVDFVSIVFLAFLIILNMVFYDRVPYSAAMTAGNLALIAAIAALAFQADKRKSAFLFALHRWYCYPFIFFVFKEIYLMVHPIHPADYDWLLIAADHWLFGVHPTQWMAQFANPGTDGNISDIIFFVLYSLYYPRCGIIQRTQCGRIQPGSVFNRVRILSFLSRIFFIAGSRPPVYTSQFLYFGSGASGTFVHVLDARPHQCRRIYFIDDSECTCFRPTRRFPQRSYGINDDCYLCKPSVPDQASLACHRSWDYADCFYHLPALPLCR